MLGERNKIQVLFAINKYRLLSDKENWQHIFIVKSETSPRFLKKITRDTFPACVPKGRYVVVSGRLGRVGIMHVFEFWAGMQLSLKDYLQHDLQRYHQLTKLFSYSDFIKMAGNAFHISSCGHWTIAVLMMPRFVKFGMVNLAADSSD